MIIRNIKLRKIQKTDLKYFLKWWQDKELIKLTSGIVEKSPKVLAGYFLDLLNNNKNHHYLIMLGRKAIGHVAIVHRNKNSFELNIVIGEKEYWGKGYGTLAIKHALRLVFGRLQYKKAYLEVRSDNKRAIRAYEKCGFIKKGIKKYPQNKYQPVVLRMVLYSQHQPKKFSFGSL